MAPGDIVSIRDRRTKWQPIKHRIVRWLFARTWLVEATEGTSLGHQRAAVLPGVVPPGQSEALQMEAAQ